MKENVLDVLMYLFENYMYEEPEEDPDREELQTNLLEAGFGYGEINKAFNWLDELAEQRDLPDIGTRSDGPVRVYLDVELARMTTECRGFLTYLEHAGILDHTRRELVIDRVMALDPEDDVDLDDLKWIVLMVLFTQPGQEANYAWMENYLFDDAAESKH
ncbi:MAG: DUF494 domain-containing protein [Xanthomonadales bacterium]|nr:DUF494 domain-containing protein [Xanthomonadales bacterium]